MLHASAQRAENLWYGPHFALPGDRAACALASLGLVIGSGQGSYYNAKLEACEEIGGATEEVTASRVHEASVTRAARWVSSPCRGPVERRYSMRSRLLLTAAVAKSGWLVEPRLCLAFYEHGTCTRAQCRFLHVRWV